MKDFKDLLAVHPLPWQPGRGVVAYEFYDLNGKRVGATVDERAAELICEAVKSYAHHRGLGLARTMVALEQEPPVAGDCMPPPLGPVSRYWP